MLASPPLRGLRDRFAHPYQTWYECAVKATTFYQRGAMLAPIRLTNAGSCPSRQRDCVAEPIRLANAAAPLLLRSQARRKETHPHHPSAPLPPLRGSSLTPAPPPMQIEFLHIFSNIQGQR